jgi:Head domain of trimeric autotransporter adhesin
MADSYQTRAQLVSDFADNTTGAITAQLLRDYLYSSIVINSVGLMDIGTASALKLPSGIGLDFNGNSLTGAGALSFDTAKITSDGSGNLTAVRFVGPFTGNFNLTGDGDFADHNALNVLSLRLKSGSTIVSLTTNASGNILATTPGGLAIGSTNSTGTLTATGVNSFAFGFADAGEQVTASGDYSFAFGENVVAASSYAIAMGNGCVSDGLWGISFGINCSAGSDRVGGNQHQSNCFALGTNCQSYGSTSMSLGDTAISSGGDSFAYGHGPVASATNSMALGFFATASGIGSIVLAYNGDGTPSHINVSGTRSFYIGALTTGTAVVSGNDSGAIGENLNVSANGAYAIGNGITNSTANTVQIGYNDATKVSIDINGLRAINLQVYAAGTAYTVTNASALAAFGTTNPTLTLTTSGKYTIRGSFQIDLAGATFIATRTLTVKIRRTNNTAGDITNTTRTIVVPTSTTLSQTLGIYQFPEVLYTASAGDVVSIFAGLDTAPSAGALNVVAANLIASTVY